MARPREHDGVVYRRPRYKNSVDVLLRSKREAHPGINIQRGLAGSEQETPRTARRRGGPWKPSSRTDSARSAFSSALLHVPLDWKKATVHKPCQYERDSNHLG